jgi:NTP pyrophosphatase (non-canonical NTP hydrolase)
MNDKLSEIMNIAQEECAEVIQAISKCRRFGIDEIHLKAGKSNRENLTEEIGDLLCMVELMIKHGLIDNTEVYTAKTAKEEKLKKWSKIYE